jgi:LEA14-like dessication related protein
MCEQARLAPTSPCTGRARTNRTEGQRATRTALTVGALLLSACAPLNPPFEPPEVTLETLRIIRIVDAKADVSIGLRVFNPNPYALPVQRVEFEVTIDGRVAASTRSARIETLPPRGDALIELSGRIDIGAVATALMSLGSQLPIEYAVKGVITLTDGASVPFARKGRVPVTRIDRGFGPRAQ